MSTTDTDRTLFAEERKKKIVDYVNERIRVTVPELCKVFGVSGATMRNDLRDLDESGLITRTHGGAIRKSRTGYELVIDSRSGKNTDAKKMIAAAALELINDGDTIILDTGTTVRELASLLGQRKNLTVVTNDIRVAADLETLPSCEVLIIGGLLRKGFHCTIGYGMFSSIDNLSVDKAFLGANSFSARKGASTPDLSQADIKSRMIEIATRVVLLCDQSKLETDSFINFASPSQIDLLITDGLPENLRRGYEEMDIDVISAEDRG